MLGYGSVWREICMREEARRWERIGNFGEARRGGRGGGGSIHWVCSWVFFKV